MVAGLCRIWLSPEVLGEAFGGIWAEVLTSSDRCYLENKVERSQWRRQWEE